MTSAVGTKCISVVEGAWAPATIRAVFDDGTYAVELDKKSMTVLPLWYGVTSDELSFDDASHFPECLAKLGLTAPHGLASFDAIVRAAGATATAAQLEAFWRKNSTDLFGGEPGAVDDVEEHQLFVRAGFSAQALAARLRGDAPRPAYSKVYWNQIRMGGRDPSDVARAVTIDDALEALGLEGHTDDAATRAMDALDAKLPSDMRRFFGAAGAAQAVRDAQPNNPTLIAPRAIERGRAPDDALAVLVMEHHDFEWYAVFSEGDQGARIFATWDGAGLHLVAPTLSFFFWDLAQSGLAWWKHKKPEHPLRRTELGLARVP